MKKNLPRHPTPGASAPTALGARAQGAKQEAGQRERRASAPARQAPRAKSKKRAKAATTASEAAGGCGPHMRARDGKFCANWANLCQPVPRPLFSRAGP